MRTVPPTAVGQMKQRNERQLRDDKGNGSKRKQRGATANLVKKDAGPQQRKQGGPQTPETYRLADTCAVILLNDMYFILKQYHTVEVIITTIITAIFFQTYRVLARCCILLQSSPAGRKCKRPAALPASKVKTASLKLPPWVLPQKSWNTWKQFVGHWKFLLSFFFPQRILFPFSLTKVLFCIIFCAQ